MLGMSVTNRYISTLTGYKCDFIEKYLGDKENEERTILTPPELYELWNSLSLMEQAL